MKTQEAIEQIKWTPLMRYEADKEEKSELAQALDMAIAALEKQIPKKPKHIHEEYEKHEWKKNKDGKIDEWAYSVGYCNGPVCERCGQAVCMHCNPNYDDEPCIVDVYVCSVCGSKVSKYFDKEYCKCGQKLDWSEQIWKNSM